ncbi:MAG: lipocalin family protein [Variovorax sp.]
MKAEEKARRNYSRFNRRRSRSRRSLSRRLKVYLLPLLALVAAIGVGLLYLLPPEPVAVSGRLAGSTAASLERTAALPPLNLPADDAPHGAGMEWWYYNGILDAKTGGRYAFHVAVFVANGLIKHTVMHAALTDLQTGKRYASQNRTGGVPAGIGKDGTSGFDFRQEGWQVAASGPKHVLRASFEGVSIALDLTDARPAVAHRAAGSETPGLLDFGKSGISYYYSRPRIAAVGEVSVAGKPVQVAGEVWFDHQWGDFNAIGFGWNWFALHLEDGSDVMLYEIFDGDGRKIMAAGTVSDAKGAVPLRPRDVELIPVATWTSPKTKIAYVVEWKLKLPSGEFDIKPFFADGEFDSRETTANVYWEGPVKVTGSASGEGFLELSGYDRLKPAPAGAR